MAEAAQRQLVDIDPDFEPLSRPRSCTWPLPRPDFSNPADSNTSSPAPSVKQEPANNADYINNLSLLEENEDYPDQKPMGICSDFSCQENCIQAHPHQQQQQLPSPQIAHQQQVPLLSSPVGSTSSVAAAAAAAAQRKSSSSRRNAWGNMSYADLITKAIESSPEKRLTLSQIYDWMVKSVPYFKDKGDSNSSAGWKGTGQRAQGLPGCASPGWASVMGTTPAGPSWTPRLSHRPWQKEWCGAQAAGWARLWKKRDAIQHHS
ncbi:hypothetical protein ACEWY4_008779 [Coilia grayii]|uniref:Fork-head domain-containing protein n=1 Tax=Coilia grayii TaxID=363190 RepID=A0ABD1KC97_9TELE